MHSSKNFDLYRYHYRVYYTNIQSAKNSSAPKIPVLARSDEKYLLYTFSLLPLELCYGTPIVYSVVYTGS